jgi:hypothetical protein
VIVKIAVSTVDNSTSTTGKGPLQYVRDAIESRGTSLVDSRRDRDELPLSIVSDSELAASSRSSRMPSIIPLVVLRLCGE